MQVPLYYAYVSISNLPIFRKLSVYSEFYEIFVNYHPHLQCNALCNNEYDKRVVFRDATPLYDSCLRMQMENINILVPGFAKKRSEGELFNAEMSFL